MTATHWLALGIYTYLGVLVTLVAYYFAEPYLEETDESGS